MSLPNLIDGVTKAVADAMPSETGRVCVLSGGFDEIGCNVISDGKGYVEIQFDIPEDHWLFGRDDPEYYHYPFTGVVTVHDEDGTTTWARIVMDIRKEPVVRDAESLDVKNRCAWGVVGLKIMYGFDHLLS